MLFDSTRRSRRHHSGAQVAILASAFLCVVGASSQAQCPDLPELRSTVQGGHRFGFSLDMDGGRAVVGSASGDHDVDTSGVAWVYRLEGGVWVHEDKLVPSSPLAGSEFGWDVAIDGDFIVVGARRDNENGSSSGSAYVFERVGSIWSQTGHLVPGDGQSSDFFGSGVDVSADTERVVVGAFGDDDNGTDSGSVYVFEKQAGVWTQTSKLVSDPPGSRNFGQSVAVDGPRILVGALHPDNSAYVFVQVGSIWLQQERLKATGAVNFGHDVDLAADGTLALIGAPSTSSPAPSGGAAYVFRLDSSTGSWNEEAKLLASDTANGDALGSSVALQETRAVVGARGDNNDGGSDVGAAYVYDFDPLSSTWPQSTKLVGCEGGTGDEQGTGVALDGARCLVGGPRDDDQGSDSGACFAFEEGPMGWAESQKLLEATSVRLSKGGSLQFELDAGPEYANQFYLVLGSASGSSPGTPVLMSGLVLPLAADMYTTYTLRNPNLPPLFDSFGLLNSQGSPVPSPEPRVDVPAGTPSGLAGTRLHHAVVILEFGTGYPLAVSNACPLDLIP